MTPARVKIMAESFSRAGEVAKHGLPADNGTNYERGRRDMPPASMIQPTTPGTRASHVSQTETVAALSEIRAETERLSLLLTDLLTLARGDEGQAQFEREVGVYRQQIQRMDDSLRTLMTSFDREAPKLDSATRETRRASIGQREAEYQARARGIDSTMQARQAQLVKILRSDIHAAESLLRDSHNEAH